MELKGKKILVVGLGKSGIAAADFCAAQGAVVTATDQRLAAELTAAQARLARHDITYRLGRHELNDFLAAELVVVSPGVALDQPGLVAARERGIPMIGELELALQQCTTPVLAVTGTNGKTTTTALLGAMLEAAGRRVVVAGNIGTPLLDLLPEARAAEFIVLEVSSYQIEITPSLQPATAIVLNVTPDHLDRYGTFDEYAAAKRILTDRLPATAHLVFNGDDQIVTEMALASAATSVHFTSEFWDDGIAVTTLPSGEVRQWDFRGAKLAGRHNQENLLAAGLAAALHGASDAVITRVGLTFAGLPHRCQLIHEWHGIQFFDDSKGTNVGAVARSLDGFTQPVILIAGGQDKQAGYGTLRDPVRRHVKQLILLGEAQDIMARELGDCTTTVQVDDMASAVRAALVAATAGDAVLLSPACASFDQYRDYVARGTDFQKWVVHYCTEQRDVGT